MATLKEYHEAVDSEEYQLSTMEKPEPITETVVKRYAVNKERARGQVLARFRRANGIVVKEPVKTAEVTR